MQAPALSPVMPRADDDGQSLPRRLEPLTAILEFKRPIANFAAHHMMNVM
jgi:hypothetical protein